MADMFRPVPIEQEPKRENRFVVEFPTEMGIESYLVKSCKKPSFTVNSVEIPYMNTFDYVAGQVKVGTVDIEFIDVIGPSTSQKIMEWFNVHFEGATGRMGYAVGYKKNLVIKALDPVGVEVEKWVLIGAMLTNVDFGNFDHSSDAIANVKITVQPSRAILNA